MFKKFFKVHTITLILGLMIFAIDFILGEFFNKMEFSYAIKIGIILCFTITMICYSKLILTLKKVTDITKTQAFLAILSHTLTLLAICLWKDAQIAVPFAFIGSVMIRRLFGIREIDNQMEDLCQQLDFELYKMGKENGDEE